MNITRNGLCIIIGLAVATSAHGGIRQARYKVLGAGEKSARRVVDLSVTVLDEQPDGFVDWQMDATFEIPRIGIISGKGKKEKWGELDETERKLVSIRALSEHAPMTSNNGCGTFKRYVYRMPGGETFDYRQAGSDTAALPVVAFRELMLPRPEDEAVLIDGFAGAGQLLAHVLVLVRVSAPGTFDAIEGGKVLHLDGDLWVGTSRSFRDDGKGRSSPVANYSFIPLVGEDFKKLIAAGHNYFGVTADQLQWVQSEPVFYRGPAVFPDDFYRSNYVSGPMFSDEPMVRLGWQGAAPEELDHPQQMASFLKSRVEHLYRSTSSGLELYQHLARSGNPPAVNLDDFIIAPTWETEYQAAFYELAGGAPGIVHEGRYIEDGYGWHPKKLFGPGLEVTTREMLLCYYAFLRGAARAFDGDWGTSIYGQSDPAMREEALTLAYDLGARYLWFWTSDHSHHMEFPDQLALGQALKDHAKQHPRKDLDTLKRIAKVGIVFPRGYTLAWDNMWGLRCFSREERNRTDTTYRDVSAAALWQGVLCAKKGIPFDFTVDHANVDKLGYEQLLFVDEDATVRCVPDRVQADPALLKIALTADEAHEIPPVTSLDKPLVAMNTSRDAITIDGDLSDWSNAQWLSHSEKPSGDGQWDGPADLSTKFAFAFDDTHLYVAAEVIDDIHSQPFYGWDLWKGDSLQIGFDGLNKDNVLGYSGNQHEIALIRLDDGRAIAWRYHGRRGQRRREMTTVDVAVVRQDDRTCYEAAIPLSELTPLSPGTTPIAGFGITVNDADAQLREVFHETSPEAMTAGKNPRLFRKLAFTEPDVRNNPQSCATIVWDRLVVPQGDAVTFDLATRSRGNRNVIVEARLKPLSPLQALEAVVALSVEAADKPMTQRIKVKMDTPSGRYELTIMVKDHTGAAIAHEQITVFVY